MKRKTLFTLGGLLIVLMTGLGFRLCSPGTNDHILSYTADPNSQHIELYWKDDKGRLLRNLGNVKTLVEAKHKTLLFAMNGGMYKMDNSPQGVFIQNGKTITPLDTSSGGGNFYMKPNGVFYINNSHRAGVVTTPDFESIANVELATQSGPMLVINGEIHPAFKEGSVNLNIRNGVGILPDGKVLFAMSKEQINFYDFAKYFKEMGCKNALYLDGYVSRAYLPEQNWRQMSGDFGVLIGVSL